MIGVVLAGGDSRRMGQPKALLKHPHGGTFLENALNMVAKVTRSQIVAGGESSLVEGFSRPYLHAQDLRPGLGPLAGIEATLATGVGLGYLIIAVDQPRLNLDLLLRLCQGNPDCVHAYTMDKAIVPLPAYVPHSSLRTLNEVLQGEDHSIRKFYTRFGYTSMPLEEEDLALVRSVNTPEEYERLIKGVLSDEGI